jgi:VCBS repeat-containing protein
VLGNDSDPEGDPLTAVQPSTPSNGSVTLNGNGSFSYTPNANFNGSDSFTYRASDGSANSSPATVTITVNPVNDPPTAANDSYSTNEDTTLNIAAPGVLGNDSDPDGDSVSAVLQSGPSSGSLTLNGNGSFSYKPNDDFNGTDSFTYRASDGSANSSPATVTINVNPVNDPPTAGNDSYSINEDTTLNIAAPGVLANDNDPEGQPLTAVLQTGPSSGSLNLNGNGSFSYTPNANFNGTDSFTYRANDGSANSSPATVTITVNPVNDTPAAVGDTYTTDEDIPLTIAAPGVLANDTDPDGQPLTAVLQTGPTDGLLTLNSNGSFTYTPNADFSGTDSFTYRANDGSANSNLATVTINISEVNDPPAAVDDTYTTDEDIPLTIAAPGVLANDNDPEGQPLTAVLQIGPTDGLLNLNGNGSFTYTPNDDFNGTDSFTYFANDGTSNSNLAATVTIPARGH